jgi:hypothetical protein
MTILLALAVPCAASSDYSTYINANDILMFVTNEGGYGRDIADTFGRDHGTFYPYTTNADIESGLTKSPLFAAGIWLGGQVDGETRVTVSEYSLEYTPGPMSGGTFAADAYTNDAYRVYKLYVDSGHSNPNADYLEWPVDQGAPLDGLGRPLMLGDQTLWSVFNDADTSKHTSQAGETDPLGIEIQQTVWANDGFGQEAVVYVGYKLYNKGTNNITDFHIGIWQDAEIGEREDDVAGCDSTTGVMFSYNNDNDDQIYGTQPPAFGARLLFGPVVPSASDQDSAYFDGAFWPNHKNLEMSACATYVNGADPETAQQSYNLMRGYMVDGSPFASGTRYRYPGDPVTGVGHNDPSPTDKKQVASFGPLDFNPGDSQFVMIKLAVGQSVDRLASLTLLIDILVSPDDIPTEVGSGPTDGLLPSGYVLHQNHPNPFNPTTTIEYSLPRRGHVTVEVFNVLGQRVRTLVDRVESAGSHAVVWNGTDASGEPVATGLYLYRLQAGRHIELKKMLLMK